MSNYQNSKPPYPGQGNRNYNSVPQAPSYDILKDLEKALGSLKEKKPRDLEAKYYAMEDGIAYRFAESIGKNDDLKTNQLRKFFTQIRKIEQKYRFYKPNDIIEKNEVLILLPQLAYAQGRKVLDEGKNFYYGMSWFIKNIDTVADLTVFISFYEAIIAYSKYLNKTK